MGLSLLVTRPVRAQEPPEPITDNHYNIDIAPGPVMGSSRTMGLAGAYTSIAEGTETLYYNPAGLAIKRKWSRSYWDWDWAADWFLTGLFGGVDFENNGSGTAEENRSFLALDLGTSFRVGRVGLGALFRMRRYTIDTEDHPRLEVRSIKVPIGLAVALFEDQLSLGLDAVWQFLNLNDTDQGDKLVGFSGATAGLSALYRPRKLPFRLGLSAVLPGMSVRDAGGSAEGDPLAVRGIILPQGVAIPWSLTGGISFCSSKAPYNYPRPKSVTPTESALSEEPEPPRRYLLVSMDVEVIGSSKNATGLEAFIRQERQPAGESATISPRLGVESEVVENWLRLRGGTYYEPSRFTGVEGRWHGTGGFDLRLFETHVLVDAVWKVSAAMDAARNYTNLGLSVGWWH